MRQAELWYADLNPVKGSEQDGFRPIVILSGNLMNTHLNTVICCPLTTKIKNYHGNVILQPDKTNGLKSPSENLTTHVSSLSKERLVKRIGIIKEEQLQRIKNTLNDLLKY